MRIAIKTFGCRLNQAEADRFADDFATAGWQVVPFGASADAVLIHSCAVTRAAERDGLRLARSIRRQAGATGCPEPFVALCGCVVAADLTPRTVAGVDLLVPRGDQAQLVALVTASLTALRPAGAAVPGGAAPAAPRHKRALLKVQDGCNFGCAYCIVPRTRGAPVSRPFDACLAEARARVAAGFCEIVLAGCNLGCYRDGRRHLPALVAALAGLDGVARIRLSSIEPSTVEREIIDLMASCPKLCRHLHLPLQSGDPDVLRAMGRRYSPDDYAETLSHALARLPDLGLGCDIITGFPGETPAAFARTQRVLTSWPFSNLHVFPFSERPGTPAATLPGTVPREERKARARALIALLAPQRQAFASMFVGRPVELLVESVDAAGHGRGWSSPYLACRVAGVARDAIGRLITFTPTAAVDGELRGNR